MSEEKKSWREVYQAHPAADLFPLLPEDELRKLGDDILANGLKESIALWSMSPQDSESAVILDGRNRLAAMELVGMETVKPIGDSYRLSVGVRYLSWEKNIHFPDAGGVNPFLFVISRNVHRRHLTKVEQADLIVPVRSSGRVRQKLKGRVW